MQLRLKQDGVTTDRYAAIDRLASGKVLNEMPEISGGNKKMALTIWFIRLTRT